MQYAKEPVQKERAQWAFRRETSGSRKTRHEREPTVERLTLGAAGIVVGAGLLCLR
jgi:hypothetical protein